MTTRGTQERLLTRANEHLGGEEATVAVDENYQGACSVYTSNGDLVATLPKVCEALRVARYAITPDGGYGSVVIHEDPEGDVTHEDWYQWAFGASRP